jgi:DNA replicative helicase MCM subunit Mcm2 (Cdc46/Mcm family)
MDILSDKIVITRKKHRCSACSRLFDKGTKMRTQINTYDGIQAWRECPTCTELLSTYRSHFEDEDGICHQDCVNEVRELGQTPEDLLNQLNQNNHG